MYNANVVDV